MLRRSGFAGRTAPRAGLAPLLTRPGFNRQGYSQSSHGCVNIRKLSDAVWIFKNTPIGAKVHIFSPKATV